MRNPRKGTAISRVKNTQMEKNKTDKDNIELYRNTAVFYLMLSKHGK